MKPVLKSILIAVGALIYGASPIDVVPELLVGPLGFGDDALVLIAAVVAIWRILKRRRGGESSPPLAPEPGI